MIVDTTGLLGLYIAINILAIFVVAIAAGDTNVGFSFVNPKVIYESFQVNWFGTVLITIFLHVLFPVIAILYWFYKLCTVGRKE